VWKQIPKNSFISVSFFFVTLEQKLCNPMNIPLLQANWVLTDGKLEKGDYNMNKGQSQGELLIRSAQNSDGVPSQ
jgi:hypothetical protein